VRELFIIFPVVSDADTDADPNADAERRIIVGLGSVGCRVAR